MEKTITIDGREVRFKANGNTPRLYRVLFRRDIFKDISELGDAVKIASSKSEDGEGSFIGAGSLEVFENVAYVMAKQGDPSIPSIDDWFESFETFSIYQVLPELIQLWNLTNVQISESKKNIAELTGR